MIGDANSDFGSYRFYLFMILFMTFVIIDYKCLQSTACANVRHACPSLIRERCFEIGHSFLEVGIGSIPSENPSESGSKEACEKGGVKKLDALD
jgi:hypothetical protein